MCNKKTKTKSTVNILKTRIRSFFVLGMRQKLILDKIAKSLWMQITLVVAEVRRFYFTFITQFYSNP